MKMSETLYSSKEMCRIDSQLKKKNDSFEIFYSWNLLHFFLYTQVVFYSFTHT